MKTTFAVSGLLLVCSTLYAQLPSYIQDLQNTANEEKKANLWKFTQHTTRVADNYDLKYHRCIWNIDPAVYYISGSVTSFFEPKDEGFAEIDFDFAVNMTVDS